MDISDEIILLCGAVLWTVRCLAVSLASPHWVPVAPTPTPSQNCQIHWDGGGSLLLRCTALECSLFRLLSWLLTALRTKSKLLTGWQGPQIWPLSAKCFSSSLLGAHHTPVFPASLHLLNRPNSVPLWGLGPAVPSTCHAFPLDLRSADSFSLRPQLKAQWGLQPYPPIPDLLRPFTHYPSAGCKPLHALIVFRLLMTVSALQNISSRTTETLSLLSITVLPTSRTVLGNE